MGLLERFFIWLMGREGTNQVAFRPPPPHPKPKLTPNPQRPCEHKYIVVGEKSGAIVNMLLMCCEKCLSAEWIAKG